MDTLKIHYELLQNCAYALKSLINSEIAMNDGDISACQKFNKEAQSLLSTSINDSFKEFANAVEINTDVTNDYDIPNNFELIRQLNQIQCDLGLLLDMICDNLASSIIKPVQEKIVVTINTVIEIYNAIYLN